LINRRFEEPSPKQLRKLFNRPSIRTTLIKFLQALKIAAKSMRNKELRLEKSM
jgi:hypothetical protein